MAKIENQRILIWCNCEKEFHTTLINAANMALTLEKELCFFANYQTKKQEEYLQSKIKQYSVLVKKDIPQLLVSTLILQGKLWDLCTILGEKYNTIMLCCGPSLNKNILKAFYKSRFPFYFTHNTKANNKKILIPVDERSGTKESILWGSYFGRFAKHEITLFTPKKHAETTTIDFADKLYQQFSFSYHIRRHNSNNFNIHQQAIKKSYLFDMLIFTGSFNVTLLDFLIGTFEQRIINKKQCPILLINPQKEMYVLCD
jgi:hypothetical protein